MEWKSWSWGQDTAAVESPMEHDEGAEPQERSLAGEVVAHLPELWLVACAYEYMAAGTLCRDMWESAGKRHADAHRCRDGCCGGRDGHHCVQRPPEAPVHRNGDGTIG